MTVPAAFTGACNTTFAATATAVAVAASNTTVFVGAVANPLALAGYGGKVVVVAAHWAGGIGPLREAAHVEAVVARGRQQRLRTITFERLQANDALCRLFLLKVAANSIATAVLR